MAAYAATVTLSVPKTAKLGDAQGVLHGSVDITNYNQTLAEVTGITGYFRGAPTVICDGISDAGYLIRWDATSKSFKAFYPTDASDQTPTADIVAAPATQVASDVDVGAVNFIAFGRAP